MLVAGLAHTLESARLLFRLGGFLHEMNRAYRAYLGFSVWGVGLYRGLGWTSGRLVCCIQRTLAATAKNLRSQVTSDSCLKAVARFRGELGRDVIRDLI